jgi:glyoxylase-like metal-dependent hydrolase (beta-lactamase superfamily II)
VETFCQTDHIDHAILSHADDDHACGLIGVLERFSVGTLWMNRPWFYAGHIQRAFHGNFTLQGLVDDIRFRHKYLVALEKIAARKNIPVLPVFQGQTIGPLTVIAPSQDRYVRLLPDLTKNTDIV